MWAVSQNNLGNKSELSIQPAEGHWDTSSTCSGKQLEPLPSVGTTQKYWCRIREQSNSDFLTNCLETSVTGGISVKDSVNQSITYWPSQWAGRSRRRTAGFCFSALSWSFSWNRKPSFLFTGCLCCMWTPRCWSHRPVTLHHHHHHQSVAQPLVTLSALF